MKANLWVMIGSLSGLIAVAMGAFGAHGLSSTLSAKALLVWNTAAQYQMYHALALLAVGALSTVNVMAAPSLTTAGWAFVAGTLVFSGSLYALALTDVKILGAITPIGGVAFMVGWAALAWRGFGAGGAS